MKNFIANMIFTKRCPFCGEVILPYNMTCKICPENLPEIKGDICVKCGMPKENCLCSREVREYDGICSPFYYRDKVSDALQRYKFYNERYICDFFAKAMAERIKSCLPDQTFHMIVPVPLYHKKLKLRGYNQSMLLAEEIGRYINVPACSVLTKDFDTAPQHLTDAAKREGNVAGVFSVKDPQKIVGKTILLCDDIKTTGYTLSECAKVLKLWGAEKVYCVCAAITGLGIDKDTPLK